MAKGSLRYTWAVALLSTAALGYQLLLMRWLSIAHWYPFAAIIISLALLGHGASGAALSVARERALRHFDVLFPSCAILFSLVAAGCLLLARGIPFNGLELVWDWRQLLWLSALYLCLSLPFFFAAAVSGWRSRASPTRFRRSTVPICSVQGSARCWRWRCCGWHRSTSA